MSINGRNVGIIRLRKFLIDNIPAGKYDVTIKCGVFLKGRELMVSGSMSIDIGEGEEKEVEFSDRDRIWNVLFDIDLVLKTAELNLYLLNVAKMSSMMRIILTKNTGQKKMV